MFVARDGPRRDGEGAAGIEFDRPGAQAAGANFGALQILQNRERIAEFAGDGPQIFDVSRMDERAAMREVEARHVHA